MSEGFFEGEDNKLWIAYQMQTGLSGCFLESYCFSYLQSYLLLVYGRVFTIMGAVMLCVSALFQKKNNKILRNILLNISTIGGLALFFYLVLIKY